MNIWWCLEHASGGFTKEPCDVSIIGSFHKPCRMVEALLIVKKGDYQVIPPAYTEYLGTQSLDQLARL